jgi:hypothetical protein
MVTVTVTVMVTVTVVVAVTGRHAVPEVRIEAGGDTDAQ